MNSNNSTPNNINLHKIKIFLSKTGLLLALAVATIGLALITWSRVASAHDSSTAHNHASVTFSQEFGNHDDDDGTTADIGYVEVNIRVSGSGNVLVPGTDGGAAGYGNYHIVTVEDRADCDEDAFPASGSSDANAFTTPDGSSGTDFDIQNRRGDNLTSSSQIFANDAITGTLGTDHHDRHLCVQVVFEDASDDVTEYVSSADLLDFEGPMVEDVLVNDDARNQEYNLGDVIDIVVEFNETVQVERITEETGDDAALPHIDLASAGLTGRTAELLNLNRGTKLTFRYTVQFGDDPTGAGIDLVDLANAVIVAPDGTADSDSDADYRISDLAGNAATLTPSPAEEIDFRSGEVMVGLDTMVKRMGDRLVIEAMPDEYDKAGTDTLTVKSAVAFTDEDRPDSMDMEGCEEDVVDSRADAAGEGADKPSGSDYFGIDLPEDPDDMYYCFKVTDDLDRVTYTSVYRYVADNSGPRISVATVNNVLTITATDAVSGVDEDSIAWRILGSGNDRCIEGLGQFANSSDTINITSAHDGLEICIKASDNAGNSSYLSATLRHDASVVVVPDPVDPGDDMVQQPDDDMTDPVTTPDDDMTDTDQMVDCDVVVCFPSNWDDLTVQEKIAANPYRCLDTTQIRGDNGRCLGGGSALGEDPQVVIDGQPTTDPGTTPVVTPEEGDETTDPVVDEEEEEQPAEEEEAPVADTTIGLDYEANDDGTGTIVVDAPEGISGLKFAIVEEATCDDSIEDSDFSDVDDTNTIGLEAGQVESQVYVCVRGMQDDGNLVHSLKQAGEVAGAETGTETGTGTTDEEGEGGSNTFLIVIIVIGVIAVGIVVAIMLSSKKN
ncbi:hypothetical protein F4X86_01940 [Candidatus Saccharibacteria bacterium]|nr:hypothetical protein [Candidatus Saccharibacteria bacterium]